MRRTGVLVLLSAMVGALGLVVAAPAQACSCAGASTAEFAERADAVFTGRLLSREEPAELTSSADPALHVFAVDTVVKGAVAQRQEILSPVSGATCGLELPQDVPVVVFATRTADPYINGSAPPLAEGRYYSYLCDGSAPLTPQLAADLAAFSPTAPTPVPAPDPDSIEPRTYVTPAADDDGWNPWLVGGGAAVLLVVAALLVLRRRGHRTPGDGFPR